MYHWYEMPTFKSWYRGIKRLFKIGFLCLWLWFKKRDKIRLVIYPAILLFALFVTKPAVQEWQWQDKNLEIIIHSNFLQDECLNHFDSIPSWRDIFLLNESGNNLIKTLKKVCENKNYLS